MLGVYIVNKERKHKHVKQKASAQIALSQKHTYNKKNDFPGI